MSIFPRKRIYVNNRIHFNKLAFFQLLGNDDVQEFDTRWDEILLSMIKIPPDDVPESSFKLRVRESDQLKTALELYDMESHQKISMPNYQN